jgi:hypothetical protein
MGGMWGQRGVVVLALLVTACGGSSGASSPPTKAAAAPATFTLAGTVGVHAGPQLRGQPGWPCVATGGYTDVAEGTQVVVTDRAGKTVALSRLTSGQIQGAGYERRCLFKFQVPEVPAGQPFYGVTVADRGTLQYDEAEARAGVSLTLG